MTADVVLSVLGTYWDEAPLRAFLTSLGIAGVPRVRTYPSGFLTNHALGIELTFYREKAIKIRLRDYPRHALVLYNVRFYGEKSGRPFKPYTGALPLGLRFGASRDSLIQDFGPPAWEDADLGSMRWDTAQFSLFAMLSDEGILTTASLQLPVVKTAREQLR